MDQSLILLGKLLNWTFVDLMYFRSNIVLDKAGYKNKLDRKLENKIREENYGDQLLYNESLKKFNNLAIDYGIEKLEVDVKTLREMNGYYLKLCTTGNPVSTEDLKDEFHKLWIPKGLPFRIGGWKLNKFGETSDICKMLVADELLLTDKLRKKV